MAANATERLKDQIENEIAAGRLLPGDRLDEVSLAARYGVSRTPIR
jgi:DNA-binding GntR family transcriptional regulator